MTATEEHALPELSFAASPHLRDKLTTPRVMRGVVVGLTPAIAMSIYNFHEYAVLLIATCVGACCATEAVFQKLRGQRVTLNDWSAVVTGVLLAMVLPPRLFPHSVAAGTALAAEVTWLAVAALGSVVAIALVKHLFGGLGANPFNPALMGRAFLMAAFPTFLVTWTHPVSLGPLDAVTEATPLAAWKFAPHALAPLSKLLVGGIPGSLGETSALALLIGGLYILIRGYADWRTPVAFLATVFVLTGALWLWNSEVYAPPVFHLLAGGLMLGAFFMATDPVTTPVTKVGRWVFGVGAGGLVVLIRVKGGLPEGVMYAILLMNAVSPLLDRCTRPVVFGERNPYKPAGIKE